MRFPFSHQFIDNTVIVRGLFRQPYCWGITGIDFLLFLRDRMPQLISWSLALLIFLLPLPPCALSLGCRGYVVDVSVGWVVLGICGTLLSDLS